MATTGGCYTCKSRRVKCDETRPVCQRCNRADRICIAAPVKQRASFTIHAENDFASGNAKRPRGPRSSLVKEPQIDLETKALSYYYQFHIETLPDAPVTVSGLSECVTCWQASGRVDEMVDLSLLSMALAVYSQTHDDEVAAANASSKYYLLLQMVQKRITEVQRPASNESDIDACLLTIFVMGRFEGVMHRYDSQNPREAFKLSQSWSHHDGALAILNVWNDRFSHEPASSIVKHTRRGQIRSAIMRNRPVPDWLLDGNRYGECELELEYDRAIVKLVLARRDLLLAKARSDNMTELRRLGSEVEDIDVALQNWMSKISPGYPRSEHTLRKPGLTPRPQFYSPRVYSYSERGHAAVWNQYHVARILTISTRLRLIDTQVLGKEGCRATKAQQHSNWSKVLNEMADDVASSIPFFTGCLQILAPDSTGDQDVVVRSRDEGVKSYLLAPLIWPLTVAASVPEVDADQQLWFRSELARIGKICGGGMIASADTEQWTLRI